MRGKRAGASGRRSGSTATSRASAASLNSGSTSAFFSRAKASGGTTAKTRRKGSSSWPATCLLIVEGEERELKTWDFFHSPPQTEHIIVGAGDGPSVVVAVGARGLSRKGLVYPVSKAAQKHGVSVTKETTKPAEAYADLPPSSRVAYRDGWLPDR